MVLNDGRFRLPRDETRKQKRSAYVKYWRLKSNLSVDEDGLLLYQGRKVLKKNEIKKLFLDCFERTCYRKPISFDQNYDLFLIKTMLKEK